MAGTTLLSIHTSFVPNFPYSSLYQRPHFLPSLSRFRTRCTSTSTTSSGSRRAPKVSTSGTIPWGCETDSLENASALEKWLTESGLPQQKMDIERVDVGERGLVAVKNIRKGERLLYVPPSLIITADSVSFSDFIL